MANMVPGYFRARIDRHGRLVIPVDLRRHLDICPGEPVTVWAEDGQLHVITVKQAIRDLQETAAKYKRPGESVVDEFLRGRREEAARE